MEARASSLPVILLLAVLMAAASHSYEAAVSKGSFEDNFSIMWSEDHFSTSKDGQIWYLSLDKDTGTKSMTWCILLDMYSIILVWSYLKDLFKLQLSSI